MVHQLAFQGSKACRNGGRPLQIILKILSQEPSSVLHLVVFAAQPTKQRANHTRSKLDHPALGPPFPLFLISNPLNRSGEYLKLSRPMPTRSMVGSKCSLALPEITPGQIVLNKLPNVLVS
jgi:hypothetical protein